MLLVNLVKLYDHNPQLPFYVSEEVLLSSNNESISICKSHAAHGHGFLLTFEES